MPVAVPTSQSEVTVMRSHDNQPKQDDERSQVEINNGMCVHMCCYSCVTLCLWNYCVHTIVSIFK